MKRRVTRYGSLPLGLVRHGYTFASHTAALIGTDVFRTRVLVRKAVVARGAEAVAEFYVPGRMTRRGAQLPPARILQDKGTVQLLDGADHRDRKALLMSLLDEQGVARLTQLLEARWHTWLRDCPAELNLLDEGRVLLCQAACEWTGIAPGRGGARRRARDLALLVEAAGSISARAVRAQYVHRRTLSWAAAAVRRARCRADLDEATPLERIADYPSRGRELPAEVGAGEVLNLLRPIVAVAHYVVFAAIAMHEHPDQLPALDTDEGRERFVQEVRRHYPFFPLVAGRVVRSFDWRGMTVEPGTKFFLDLYGTNHDPKRWRDPHLFRPDRFAEAGAAEFLVPQGGGDVHTGHRCAGDRATLELVKTAVRLLREAMTYDVPPQDLSLDLSRIPALPRHGMLLANVRPERHS
jgi:fatty-acid peroxygenase